MLIETISANLHQALVNGDSIAASFASFDMLATTPTAIGDPVGPGGATDGVFNAGHEGIFAQNRLFLLPYALGAAGSGFSLRVYGWRPISHPDGLSTQRVWIPYFLVELACTTCARPGPGPAPRKILNTERMCDTITLTRGNLGPTGYINSNAGTNLIAYAILEISGCKKFQFDFQQTAPVGMNALWSFV